MAVLVLLMVMMVQISNGILTSTRIQNQQLDSVASARRAIDILTKDISTAIVGTSSTILVRPLTPGQDFIAMVCQRLGPTSANLDTYRFLAVQYSMDSSGQLFRKYNAVNFPTSSTSPNLLTSATISNPTPPIPLASGLLGFSLRILTTDTSTATSSIRLLSDSASPSWAVPNTSDTTYNGLTVPSGWKALVPPGATFVTQPTRTSRAIEIWVAAIEPQTYALLESSGQLSAAQGVFSNPSTSPHDWRTAFDAADVPASAKSALRIINKTVPLP